MSNKTFRTTSAPEGWKLGVWKKKSQTEWTEFKDDGTTYDFEITVGPETPGSDTVRLKMKDADTEVLLLEKTVQVFVDGHYFGEYRGEWQIGGKAIAPAASPVQSRAVNGGAPQGVATRELDFSAPVASHAEGAAALTGAGRPAARAKAANLDQSPATAQSLQDAVKDGQLESVKRLLAAGADPDQKGRDGKTPLLTAVEKGAKVELVEELLNAGADVSIAKDGVSPLTAAFEKGNLKVLRLLLREAFSCLKATSPVELGLNSTDLLNQSSCGAPDAMAEDWEAPEFLIDELRQTTASLAKLNTSAKGLHESGFEDSSLIRADLFESADSDKMREECVRDAMNQLIKSSKLTDTMLGQIPSSP